MNWIMKYSTHLLTLFTVCLCIWGVINREGLSALQLTIIGFGVLVMLHEWEEMHWPGGFMDMMGGIIGWDISGIRPGAQHTSQSFFIALIVLLPVCCPTVHWLFCGVMVFGIMEGIMHVAGIKVANAPKPYTPGMITGIIMFIYCIAAIVIVYGTESITAGSWILGFVYFMVWFIIMMQMVITFCQFNRKKFMKAMMGMAKSRFKNKENGVN